MDGFKYVFCGITVLSWVFHLILHLSGTYVSFFHVLPVLKIYLVHILFSTSLSWRCVHTPPSLEGAVYRWVLSALIAVSSIESLVTPVLSDWWRLWAENVCVCAHVCLCVFLLTMKRLLLLPESAGVHFWAFPPLCTQYIFRKFRVVQSAVFFRATKCPF